ncbi:MAG TPA: DUF2510 domain-containing protein, partial [Nakamurella sp.]|nr:DUF2510 domain-containing protein [Nakamurella sp.]
MGALPVRLRPSAAGRNAVLQWSAEAGERTGNGQSWGAGHEWRDPLGSGAPRWWDGVSWTQHSAPPPGGFTRQPYASQYTAHGYARVNTPYGSTTVVTVASPKSVGVAFLLT